MRVRLAGLSIVVLVLFAGCLPDVVWLPDSSGVVYTITEWPEVARNQECRLLHYDLASKSSRTVVRAKMSTIRPALSPDGKRVAVASLGGSEGQSVQLQIKVFDLQGREIHSSKRFEWGKANTAPSKEGHAQLVWEPDGEKVLIHAIKRTGIYDLKDQRVIMLGEAVPAIFGTSPIRPDGKGFLAVRDDLEAAFADWQGREKEIRIPKESRPGFGDGALMNPVAYGWSRWEGPVAILTWKRGQLRVDTTNLRATFHEPPEAEWAFDGKEIQELYTFPGGKSRVVVFYRVSMRDSRDAGLPSVRAEWIGPIPQRRRILVDETAHCGLFPSPNRQQLALRYMVKNPGGGPPRDRILIVNEEGEELARLSLGE